MSDWTGEAINVLSLPHYMEHMDSYVIWIYSLQDTLNVPHTVISFC